MGRREGTQSGRPRAVLRPASSKNLLNELSPHIPINFTYLGQECQALWGVGGSVEWGSPISEIECWMIDLKWN